MLYVLHYHRHSHAEIGYYETLTDALKFIAGQTEDGWISPDSITHGERVISDDFLTLRRWASNIQTGLIEAFGIDVPGLVE